MSIRFAFGAKVRKKEALIQAVRSLAASGGQGVQEDNDIETIMSNLTLIMDARSIAATAANGGRLTSAWEMDCWGNGSYLENATPHPADLDSIRRQSNLWMHWADPSSRA